MRTMVVWMAMIAGCAGLFSPSLPTSISPDEFVCPSGTTMGDAAALAAHRVLPDTEILLCLDGSRAPVGLHLEYWRSEHRGADLAVEGIWSEGRRDGVWTSWRPDGAFRSQATWKDGQEQGTHVELGHDGRLVELEMVDGEAMTLRTRPRGSPMPQWDEGKRREGTRHEQP